MDSGGCRPQVPIYYNCYGISTTALEAARGVTRPPPSIYHQKVQLFKALGHVPGTNSQLLGGPPQSGAGSLGASQQGTRLPTAAPWRQHSFAAPQQPAPQQPASLQATAQPQHAPAAAVACHDVQADHVGASTSVGIGSSCSMMSSSFAFPTSKMFAAPSGAAVMQQVRTLVRQAAAAGGHHSWAMHVLDMCTYARPMGPYLVEVRSH
jgi:hypothetical protein